MKRLALLSAVAALALGAGVQAAMTTLISFEASEAIVPEIDGTGMTATVVAAGATHGTQALALTGPGAFHWVTINVAAEPWAALMADEGRDIWFDYSFTGTAAWANGKAAIQGSMLPSYTEFGDPDFVETEWNKKPAVGFNTTPNVTYTGHLQAPASFPSEVGTWRQLVLAVNWDGASNQTMYIDNIRTGAIPEPTSMAVLGLSGLALLARRRK